MTQQQKDIMRISWPLVALVMVLGLFFLGIFALIPKDMPEGRTALLGLLTVSATGIMSVAIQRLSGKVDQVQQQTNGHMTTLIESKTQPDVSRETPRIVRDEQNEGGPW